MTQKRASPPSTFMASPSLPAHSFREVLSQHEASSRPDTDAMLTSSRLLSSHLL